MKRRSKLIILQVNTAGSRRGVYLWLLCCFWAEVKTLRLLAWPAFGELIEFFLPDGGLLRFAQRLVKVENVADGQAPGTAVKIESVKQITVNARGKNAGENWSKLNP